MVGGGDDDDEMPSLYDGDGEDDPADATRAAEDLRLLPHPGQRPWLLVVGGRRSLGMLVEVRGRLTIGRAAPVDLLLDEEGVSRRHAQVDLVPGGAVRILDLGSSNGIRVGGRLVKTHTLRMGDRVRLGDAVLTLIHFDDNRTALATNLRASADALARQP